MPLYEFHCEPCNYTFETLIRGASDFARCPQCGNVEVSKQFSVPAAAHSGRGNGSELPIRGEPSTAFGGGCGRPQCGSGMCAGLG
jgi:putative FmdB family regulatory protein